MNYIRNGFILRKEDLKPIEQAEESDMAFGKSNVVFQIIHNYFHFKHGISS